MARKPGTTFQLNRLRVGPLALVLGLVAGACAGGPPELGRGVTETTIKIGIGYNAAVAEGGLAIPGQSQAPGEQKVAGEAVVKWINENGGMAGRQVEPFYFGVYENNAAVPFPAQAQVLCTFFTQDNPVFAVSSTARPLYALPACLAKGKTVLVMEYSYLYDKKSFDDAAPYFYQPSSLNGSRWGVVIDQLLKSGFFDDAGKAAKIGIMTLDSPIHSRIIEQTIQPKLKEEGFAPAQVFAGIAVNTLADLDTLDQQIDSTVLRFKADGITHVIFMGIGAGKNRNFWRIAADQKYLARYAITSTDLPALTTLSNSPLRDLKNTWGVGWWPLRDTGAPTDPTASNPQRVICKNVFREVGLEIPSRHAEANLMIHCDNLLFLKAALDKVKELELDVTAAGLREAVDKFGTEHVSPFALSTRFGPNIFDGAAEVRPFGWDEPCGCWKYTGESTNVDV